jgi:hypothetical protein
VAVSPPRRARGLGGVDALGADHGMLFVHGRSRREIYWMKGMRFPIDIIWCHGGRVVHVTPDVPPPGPGSSPDELPRLSIRHDADMVIEVPAGWAAVHGVEPGGLLSLA